MSSQFAGPGADRLLAAIVESSDDAIIAKDLSGTILAWNRGAERMFGFSAAEAVGQSIRIVIPDERLAEEAELLRQIESGAGVSHLETVRRRKDGSLVDISLTVSPIYDADGRIVGASKIARDITEAHRLLRQLDEASRLKDEFLATLSHELRTPLNAIAGYSRMLRMNALDASRRQRAVEIIERNAEMLARLVGDLLDVSRIVSGKLRLNAQQCDLAMVAGEAIESVRPAIEAKALRLERIIDRGAGPVWADPERLLQVFWNLLTNAVKFTPRGGRIQVRVERVEGNVEFVVSDTGIGISETFLPHVFERFRQADARTTREYGGLGVGLAIVRHVVELHGGTVEVTSEGRDTGTTFRVKLPLLAGTSDKEGGRFRRGEPITGPGSRNRPLDGVRVVAVDDDPDSLTLVGDVLQMAGATVVPATSAADALAVLARARPDVLLVDVGMPQMDGYQLIRRVRSSDSPWRDVPAAALTAFARPEDRTRSLLSGFQMHLPKPVDPGELVAAVASLAGLGGTLPVDG